MMLMKEFDKNYLILVLKLDLKNINNTLTIYPLVLKTSAK